ncbi:MAG: glycoside hydrolase family 13 protein [Gammaproteobacteria bacterium]
MPRLFRLIAAVPLLMAAQAWAQSIERIEPPHWFEGFREPVLQLMVHGEGVGRLEPSVDAPGLRIERVERGDSPNYLFVYIHIAPEADAGSFELRFEGDGVALSHPYELKRRSPHPGWVRGFTSADAIYLITPDRFANGDPSNDSVPGMGDEPDRGAEFGRHGGDIEGIIEHLDYIRDLGFTAIWLNPVLENRMPEASYHGYATTDFYRVDPRFGSNEDSRRLAREARKRGMGLIMDMIVNHIGTGHWWMEDLPTKDWLNFPELRPITNHRHVTQMDPYASRYDLQAFADGWFVDTMPDLNQRNALLGDYLAQNALWWIETLGLAGIRHDTHPYPDKHYMTEWSRRIMEEYPDFNVVGEEWNGNPVVVSYWQRGKQNHDGYVSYLPSLMDFPLQEKLADALVAEKPGWGSSWDPVYETLATDSVYPDPFNLVIFPDNHDMDRMFTQLNEDLALMRMAMVYVATMRGAPQVYYGTEILRTNAAPGNHGQIRSDMPGGWPGDAVNAFTGEGLSADQREMQELTRKLFNWRRDRDVIHHGKLMQFSPIGEIYAYFRYDEDDTVMVVFNKNAAPVDLSTRRFAERLGDAATATDVLTGKTLDIREHIPLAPRSVRLLEVHSPR